jgi:hypothetical protein
MGGKTSRQRRIEPTERVKAGRRGWINGAVLVALIVTLAAAAARVMVPTDRWQYTRYHLPDLGEALRIILNRENPRAEDPNPPGVPTLSLPAPVVMPEQPLLDP